MEQRFGVVKAKATKKCNHWACRKAATVIIGDIKQPHVPMNYWLCEEHAQMLLEKLSTMYGTEVAKAPESKTTEVVESSDKSKSTLDGLLRIMYSTSGKISKTDIVELCKETGVELPENASDLKIKELIELLAPELKTAQEGEANV